jgi:hypothetical protein
MTESTAPVEPADLEGAPTGGPDLPADPGPVHHGRVVSADVGPSTAVKVKAAAQLLGCSDRRVRDFIVQGRLDPIPGKPLRVTRASVDLLIAERAERGTGTGGDLVPAGAPTGGPSDELQQVLQALAVLRAEITELRAEVRTVPALEVAPAPKRWAVWSRRNRAQVPTDDAPAALARLRQHYTAEEIRAALEGGPE